MTIRAWDVCKEISEVVSENVIAVVKGAIWKRPSNNSGKQEGTIALFFFIYLFKRFGLSRPFTFRKIYEFISIRNQNFEAAQNAFLCTERSLHSAVLKLLRIGYCHSERQQLCDGSGFLAN